MIDVQDIIDDFNDMPFVMKAGIVIGGGLGIIFVLGYVFHALAHATRGWKDFQLALKS